MPGASVAFVVGSFSWPASNRNWFSKVGRRPDTARQPRSHDHRLPIVRIGVGRQHERGLTAVADGPSQEPLEDPPLLGWTGRAEGVSGVQRRIAEDDVRVAVVLLRARLDENLDAATARPRVLGRVRVLIDLDLLDGGRAHVEAVDLHPVDYDGRSARPERARVQQLRQRRHVVVVDRRQILERVLIDRDRVGVAGRRGADCPLGAADGHLLPHTGQRQHDPNRGSRAGAHRDPLNGRLEAGETGPYPIGARPHGVEVKGPGAIRPGRLDNGRSLHREQLDRGRWQGGAGLVLDDARHVDVASLGRHGGGRHDTEYGNKDYRPTARPDEHVSAWSSFHEPVFLAGGSPTADAAQSFPNTST